MVWVDSNFESLHYASIRVHPARYNASHTPYLD